MKQAILTNWTFFRVIRLVIGVAIVVQAIIAKDALFGVVGLLLTTMPILNIGCCGTNGCYTLPKKSTIKTQKEISYEEVV